MESIKCSKCGTEIVDGFKYCPVCGESLMKTYLAFCTACGCEVTLTQKTKSFENAESNKLSFSCPKCGNTNVINKKIFSKSEEEMNAGQSSNVAVVVASSKKTKKEIALKVFISIILTLSILCAIAVPVAISEISLYGNDLIAYDLLLEATRQIEIPKNFELKSGRIVYNYDLHDLVGYFVIAVEDSAEKDSKKIVAMCICYKDDKISVVTEHQLGEKMTNAYSKNALNYKKINRHVRKYWKDLKKLSSNFAMN